MEKRVIGVVLTLLGIAGLILAGVKFIGARGEDFYRAVGVYGVLGLIFFVAGISLVKNTRDVVRRDEHIS